MKYEYKCQFCKNVFVISAKNPPKENPPCSKCKNTNTKRIWNVIPIFFRGDGFYSSKK
jgi:predicted nucleic acid-binding Zn ribbon protein